MEYAVRPIGHFRGGPVDPTDHDWGASRAVIALDAGRYGSEALAGLDDFRHAEVRQPA